MRFGRRLALLALGKSPIAWILATCGAGIRNRDRGTNLLGEGRQLFPIARLVTYGSRVWGHFSEGVFSVEASSQEKHFYLSITVGFIYCMSLWMLGASWWKTPIIAMMVVLFFMIGWGMKWIGRGALILFPVAAVVWLGAVPPPIEWRSVAAATATALASR